MIYNDSLTTPTAGVAEYELELTEEHMEIVAAKEFNSAIAGVLRKYPVVGDVPSGVEEVRNNVTVEFYKNQAKWAEIQSPEERRKYTFKGARNLSHQYADKLVRETKKTQQLAHYSFQGARRNGHLTEIEAETPAQYPASTAASQAHIIVLSAIAAVPGMDTSMLELVDRRARRSPKTFSDLKAAYVIAATGRIPEVGHIVAPLLDGKAWAAARIKAGIPKPLSTAAAVEDGAWPDSQKAVKELTQFWISHRRADAGPICAHQLDAVGLVDHVATQGPAKQRLAAEQQTLGIIATHPHLASTCTQGKTTTAGAKAAACELGADPGICLKKLQATMTTISKPASRKRGTR